MLACPDRDARQESVDLGDLVGGVGHPDLRDGDTHTVDHRGEQGELAVVGGPCASQDLAVHGDRQQAVGVSMGPLEQPRPDQQVQLPGVNALMLCNTRRSVGALGQSYRR